MIDKIYHPVKYKNLFLFDCYTKIMYICLFVCFIDTFCLCFLYNCIVLVDSVLTVLFWLVGVPDPPFDDFRKHTCSVHLSEGQ